MMDLFSFGLIMLALGFLLGAASLYMFALWLQDRHETRLANFEFRHLVHEPLTVPVGEQVLPRAYVRGNPPFGNAPKPRHAAPTTWTQQLGGIKYADLAYRRRNVS